MTYLQPSIALEIYSELEMSATTHSKSWTGSIYLNLSIFSTDQVIILIIKSF